MCKLISGLMGLLLVSGMAGGADGPPVKVGREPIRIRDCRIVLIDQVTLACDRSGILKSIECKEGQQVTARQELARIADEVARANLAVAEKKAANDVDVRFSKLASQMAEVEYRKNLSANQKPTEGTGKTVAVVPILEIEKLKLAADKGKLAIEQAEHEFALNKLNADVARAERDTYSVFAEFEGTVTRVFKKRGEAVRQGDPIVELVNPSRVRIEGRIGLADLRFAKVRARIKVRLAIPDLDLPEEREEFDGQITFIDLVSDPVTHETRVFGEVENRDNILRAGLMAEMVIEDPTPQVSARPDKK